MRKNTYNIKDLVYGANDGIITTFAIIAGVTGAALSIKTIVVIGAASLLADAFSMASSNYLATKSECAVLAGTSDACRKGREWKSAFYTFFAFVIAGSIPLMPYLLASFGGGVTGDEARQLFAVAVYATGAALFLVGSLRSFVTRRNFILSGVEMLVVGGVAAAVAYYVGSFIGALI